ncbi:hypothetical protein FOZ76_09275 [Verticiella sediminum]|uniref:N-terminal of MaoC-like dehydratase domain-containing protein n=1 Tax=Verticiella sediminum TaxID=1247510 RepID=A0A556AU07_9BURK|nr:hypothetical protein [Verticiella sediminum]TSH96419.1 hypothetical protein FOZ76_09275 [Verticiella sediminum]
MKISPFATPIAIAGPLRKPRQMLADQTYDSHKSIHDDATAADLGLRGAPIEGPTHFSQFDPLLLALWGPAWFETGCISAHYQNMVVEGEEVRAFVEQPAPDARFVRIWAEKKDGTPVLKGTASVGAPLADDPPTEIEQRIANLRPSAQLVINRDLAVGQKGAVSPEHVRMGFDQHMGEHYPFTLNDKLRVITEPCPWYTAEDGAGSPWGRPIVPTEMVSVLLGTTMGQAGFRGRGPAIGLFAGQQIRYLQGPIFVDHPYELEREIIALSESAKTESVWVRTRVYDAKTRALVAEMILNHATLKASYEPYEREARELGRVPAGGAA